MAVIQKDFNYMAFPQSFQRGNPIPLDKSSLFFGFDAMQEYARTDVTAYVGQILACVNESAGSATAYIIINATGDLKEVGAATLGDDKTITLNDGILALKNWGVEYYRWVDAVGEEGQEGYVAGHHEKQIVDETHPWLAGLEPKAVAGADGTFELAWYQPSTTTVEGLSSTVSTIRTAVDNINNALGTAETEGTIRGDIKALQDDVADKISTAGGTLTGDLVLADGGKAISDTAVANMVASAGHLKRAVVEELPEVSAADADTIYMVKDASATGADQYKEYMLIEGALVQIGDTSVDLTGYIKADETVPPEQGKLLTWTQTGTVAASEKAIADLAVLSDVDKKVDKAEGKSLIDDTEIARLASMATIKSVGSGLALSEEGVLTGAQEYVLPAATTETLGGVKIGSGVEATEGVLSAKVKAGNGLSLGEDGIAMAVATADTAGAMSAEMYVKLSNVETGAQVNTIEGVLIGEDVATINEERKVVIPVATDTAFGVVKSAQDMNTIAVDTEGVMTVNRVGVSKLANEEGTELVLNCGKA